MKQRTWKLLSACVGALLVAAAAIAVCAALWQPARPQDAAAAMPAVTESDAPVVSGTCPVCGGEAYAIDSVSNLAYFLTRSSAAMGGGGTATSCYALNLDADLTGWTVASFGTMEAAFAGHFNGNGHTLRYLANGSENSRGLFPRLAGTAERPAVVRDLNIEAELASSKDVYTGALSCYADNCLIEGVTARVNFLERAAGADKASAGLVGELGANGQIENTAVRLSGAEFSGFGGIVSACYGRVENCSVTLLAEAAAFQNFGGIAQAAMGGEIADCAFSMPAAGSFTAGVTVGGIVGNACGTKITACAAECNFTGYLPNTGQVGGIAGVANAYAQAAAAGFTRTVLTGCVASGPQITAGTAAGGIVGKIYGLARIPVLIADCETRVAAIGASDATEGGGIGGLIGITELTANVTVLGCASYGNVVGSAYVGGLLGHAGYADAASALSLTVTDCHAYGAEVRAVKADTNSFAGGAVGAVTGEAAEAKTSFQNCTAAPAVTAAGSCAGGFTGGHLVKEAVRADAVYANCKAVGNVTLTGGWGVPEYAPEQNGTAGGFIGYFSKAADCLSFVDCSAGGNINGISGEKSFCHIGGFVGYGYSSGGKMENCTSSGKVFGAGGCGGFSGRLEQLRLTNCRAMGDVYLLHGWSAGGFTGVGFGLNCENCVSYGNLINNENTTAGSTEGGFIGDCWMGGSFKTCAAYGSITNGGTYLGGFFGLIGNIASGESLSVSNCEAYGNISVLEGRSSTHGGFSGYIGINGSITFDRCVARGDVSGSRVGGFAAYVNAGEGASFTNCEAYGSVAGNGAYADEAGGFIAFIQGVSGAVLRNCAAYGASVTVAPLSSYADSGGLIGALGTSADIQNCKAYCKQVVGDVGYTGGLIGSYYGDPNNGSAANAIVKNNQCTLPGGIPVIGGRCYGMSAAYPVTESNNVGNLTTPAEDPRPGMTVRAEKSGANGVKVSVTGFQNIAATDYVTDFAVSLDGGATFTQYVYTSADGSVSGAVLAAFTGARDASGRLLAGDFSLELKNVTAYPAAGQIVVRVALSGGYAATKRL